MAIILKDWQKSIISVNDLFTNLGMEIEIDWHNEGNMFVKLASYPVEKQLVYWVKNGFKQPKTLDLIRAKYRYEFHLKDSVGLLSDLNRWVIKDKATLMIIENPQNIVFTHNRLANYEQNIRSIEQRV